jgi:hypothetical protein
VGLVIGLYHVLCKTGIQFLHKIYTDESPEVHAGRQAAIRPPLAARVPVATRLIPCQIRDGHSDTGTGLCHIASVVSCQFHPTNVPH